MKKLLFFLTWLAVYATPAAAQADSCGLRISLLTCAPGAELYSIFGHTAIRVQNPETGMDAVFNYGTFEFGPDFYPKFVRGKLPYFLSVEDFPGFLSAYQAESRSVWEQPLILNCARKQQLLHALQTNSLAENRTYRYDFLYDNCTTRAMNMALLHAPRPVRLRMILPANVPTFRDLIHQKLDSGHLDWSKLGIDLLLGARLDRKVTNAEAMFLPANLLHGFDGARAGDTLLAAPPKTLLDMPSLLPKKSGLTPLAVFSALLALIILLSFIPNRSVQRVVAFFDYLFFISLGLVGVLLLFMWLGTDHALCANNWNLLWALPTHLVAAPFLYRNRKWINTYLMVTIALQALLVIGWIFLPQELNPGFIPVILLVLLRAWLLILKPHHGTTAAAS
ncbi:MAG: hypothetical protein JWP27_1598 [Flaviaesturariibacter sp.]|nr:hypothetical protein [Flaviaesturariibacter sp.]